MAWVTKDSSESYNTEPAPQRTYTKKEKATNWWDYHRWQVLACLVGAVAVFFLIKDTMFKTVPDYQVGWVGKQELPADTAEALTAALQNLGTDQNGDGQVVVQFNQFTVDFDADSASTDAYYQMAGVTKLSADLATGSGTYIFLVEDPQGFEEQTGALQYIDGTLPDTDNSVTDWENLYYKWSDCPVLAGLDLGGFTGYTAMDDVTGQNQDLLQDVYVARRGVWDEKQAAGFAGAADLWSALTAGAVKLPGATR